ncbi:hypothetical protein I8752_26855 [Nostocaceae cyanobacterium CENA369]|uniref:Uncharacterized protein n=1 Tax=Dendronalium phyllosphericum CENA369 TaxID=1725256 RepID=A0A8J7ICT6_9NOST|nr:hypothetical protein [Dendronalium phyllosphericum]MBH8576546.1 hypothetical protein [Dendronalium phyllosphericum CENA369]
MQHLLHIQKYSNPRYLYYDKHIGLLIGINEFANSNKGRSPLLSIHRQTNQKSYVELVDEGTRYRIQLKQAVNLEAIA